MKASLKYLLILLVLFGFVPTNQKSTTFQIERIEVDGDYYYNIISNGKTYKGVDSDRMLNILCPDCYDLSENKDR